MAPPWHGFGVDPFRFIQEKNLLLEGQLGVSPALALLFGDLCPGFGKLGSLSPSSGTAGEGPAGRELGRTTGILPPRLVKSC